MSYFEMLFGHIKYQSSIYYLKRAKTQIHKYIYLRKYINKCEIGVSKLKSYLIYEQSEIQWLEIIVTLIHCTILN